MAEQAPDRRIDAERRLRRLVDNPVQLKKESDALGVDPQALLEFLQEEATESPHGTAAHCGAAPSTEADAFGWQGDKDKTHRHPTRGGFRVAHDARRVYVAADKPSGPAWCVWRSKTDPGFGYRLEREGDEGTCAYRVIPLSGREPMPPDVLSGRVGKHTFRYVPTGNDLDRLMLEIEDRPLAAGTRFVLERPHGKFHFLPTTSAPDPMLYNRLIPGGLNRFRLTERLAVLVHLARHDHTVIVESNGRPARRYPPGALSSAMVRKLMHVGATTLRAAIRRVRTQRSGETGLP